MPVVMAIKYALRAEVNGGLQTRGFLPINAHHSEGGAGVPLLCDETTGRESSAEKLWVIQHNIVSRHIAPPLRSSCTENNSVLLRNNSIEGLN